MQIAHCPIIVAAHSLGGLIVKEVCSGVSYSCTMISTVSGLAFAVSAKLRLSPLSTITGSCDPLRHSTFTKRRSVEIVCQYPLHRKRNTAEETHVF